MQKPTLVILAAGMGSRYGGMKQIDPVGDQGEIIVDFSVYDAIAAGFEKVVFVIKEEHLADFQETIGKRISPFIEVAYAFQEMESFLPQGAGVPAGRVKPWGTGHAALCAASQVEGPFAVINADDFYGREGFAQLYRFLSTPRQQPPYSFAMVGFRLGNTLTENGFVSRGVCTADAAGRLQTITERTKICRRGNAAAFTEDGEHWEALPLDAVVSMNMWAFSGEMFSELQQRFAAFLRQAAADPAKAEYFLPSVVDQLVREGKAQVEILPSGDQWYGVTYKEDRPLVRQAICSLKERGVYPARLWEKK